MEESTRGSGCAVAAVTLQLDRESEDLRRIAADAFDSWVKQLTDSLIAAGMIPDRAADVACLLINLLEGAHVLCRAAGSLEPFHRAAQAAVTRTAAASSPQA